MCARCDDLEEQVAYLTSELGLQVRTDAIARLRLALRAATPVHHGALSCAQMLAALYAADGRPLSRYQILEAVPSPSDRDRDAKIVDVWVCAARKALGRELIANVWGQGYQLSPEGMERVAYIVGDAHGKAAPSDIQELNDRESGELRSIAAHVAGILAHRDADGGADVAQVYRRIVDRLTGQPRRAA